MALRNKTILITGLVTVGLMLIFYVFLQIILMHNFARLEEQNTRRNVERVLKALNRDLSNLSATAADWAVWDDTWTFMADTNEKYISVNLVDSTFIELGLNLFLLVDSFGQVVFDKGYDLNNGKTVQIPDSVQEHLSSGALLLHHPTPENSVTGIVLLPEGPLLIASHPIVTSKYKGPVRGTLIMGRYLDSAEIERLAEITNLSLVLHRLDDSRLPADFQAALSVLTKEKPVCVRPLNQEYVAGYAMIKDIYEKPGLLLRVDLPREIYQQGKTSLRYFIFRHFL